MTSTPNNVPLLVVDDDPPVASSLRRLFRRAGFTVTVAGSGTEAVSLLDSTTPGVVISDYRMPDLSGIDVLLEVQRRFPKTICVLISGYADSGALQASMKKLQKGRHFFFVPKPWNDEAFVQRVCDELRKRERSK
ncbi:MAG: response regulator [Deltaproteobacteria bacterium]|nr:response regulator [Deltaproteobacteria bacterium]